MMKWQNYILLVIVLGAVLLCGCTESRTRVAERRWDRVIEKARIDAALESIEQGRLQYAIHILEELIESDSAFSEQAKRLLKELTSARQEIAKARLSDDMTALN